MHRHVPRGRRVPFTGEDDQIAMREDRVFENATIGEGTVIEPGVTVGLRYHPECGPARIGRNGILRQGTIIYGDVIAVLADLVAKGVLETTGELFRLGR